MRSADQYGIYQPRRHHFGGIGKACFAFALWQRREGSGGAANSGAFQPGNTPVDEVLAMGSPHVAETDDAKSDAIHIARSLAGRAGHCQPLTPRAESFAQETCRVMVSGRHRKEARL